MAAPSASGLKYASKLAGQRVLILGGTSGIGFAVSEASLEAGLLVTVSSSSAPKLSTALDRLRSSPAYVPSSTSVAEGGVPRLTGFTCDLSNPSTVEANLTQLLDQATLEGRHKFDHVVFTAGDALALTPIGQITPEGYARASAVRFTAPLILSKLLSTEKYFNHSVYSSITFTSGTNSEKPAPGWSVVAGVCGAIEGLARGLAVDLKPTRVNLVSPGAVKTELFSAFGEGEQLEQLLDGFKKQTLTGTVGTPEDVAEAYIYLMRDRYVTGRCLGTDGGRLLA
ncbi:short chain dehydrogenase, variant [Neurospora crassa OR74A]|uniref:Short chain dehydrogenase n=1 Tax=Neurospora crassa (strain ATCC 24698 / 74-OR23-1A / CBS 708.71 / DSM 1257 / FGSC 987) TaxID=367110 RepID=V5IKM1_NEUCR|nr:short chain dehydrogenase [Neurospora crassa OR74A]XP_011395143.1 short chain dehydrogenase, variant [Neurospora crassa OR74A]ESA41987.1 short chain dehydrogenase [Neurospora crassa OR74A]ESA41988.1 short chain dehydrogenase, variant [Neurospora crassa OR74A]|eukprot:XP_011395142.1 short chain dehydrogenase [Neurospora crassa OR74A]